MDGPPQHLRRGRHVDVLDAEHRERVDQSVGDRGHRADGPGFAGTLHPERIGLGRHRVRLDMERDKVGGARHGVIHERAGEDLALAVEL